MPFAREAVHFAVFANAPSGPTVALVVASDCRLDEDENLAGKPLDDLVFEGTLPLATAPLPAGFDQQSFMLMGCVVRSLQIAGALQDMLTRSVAYAEERVAFEKKISKFQAVQHNLARLAGETAAAIAAAGSAADTLARGERSPMPSFSKRPPRRFAAPRLPARERPLPTRCTARSASPPSTSCTVSASGPWDGVTISATKATGRSSWERCWPSAVPTIFGPSWPPADPFLRPDTGLGNMSSALTFDPIRLPEAC